MAFRDWYDETVLPRLISLGCSASQLGELRSQVVPLARGRVFELGCGGGFNQQFYNPAAVSEFAGIDPNRKLLDNARSHAAMIGWPADIRMGRGEAIPFADGHFDTAVCTYTLCSVEDPGQVLSELRRVLKPGGLLLFLEHGLAPDPGPAKWQRRIEPVWKHLAGNCHLTRPIGAAIRPAGFEIEPIGQNYLSGAPRWAGWMEWGVARKVGP